MNEEQVDQPLEAGPSSNPVPDEGGFQKPKKDFQHRINEVISQRKEAETRFNETAKMVQELAGQNRVLLEELRSSKEKSSAKPGAFDDFNSEELFALHSQYIDKDSESYSPGKAAMTIKEMLKRERTAMREEIKVSSQKRNSLEEKINQAFYGAVQSLGEDGEPFLQDSPQRRLASEEFERLKQDYLRKGDVDGANNPELVRVAVFSAQSKWFKQNASSTSSGASQLEQKRRAKEALSSGLGSEIENKEEVKNLYAQGQSREALSKESSIIQQMAADLKSLSGK